VGFSTLLDFEDAFESEVRRLFDQMIVRGDSGTPIDWTRIVLGRNP
jgi:hypothetical protein